MLKPTQEEKDHGLPQIRGCLFRYECQARHSIMTKVLDNGFLPPSITCFICQLDMAPAVLDESDPEYFWFRPNYLQLKRQVKWLLRTTGYAGQVRLEDVLQVYTLRVSRGELVLAPSMQTIQVWSEPPLKKGKL